MKFVRTISCTITEDDTITFEGSSDPAVVEFLCRNPSKTVASKGVAFAVFPSRNDVIRLRKTLGEWLKATRKEKR